MPYIIKDRRLAVDPRVPTVAAAETAGELNYQITVLVDRYLKTYSPSYANINEVVGVLECAKLEVYRRIAAPYEDRKAKENGDVYTCQ